MDDPPLDAPDDPVDPEEPSVGLPELEPELLAGAGFTEPVRVLAADVPFALDAATLNEYVDVADNPLISHEVAGAVAMHVPATDPSALYAVTTYQPMAADPVDEGTSNVRVLAIAPSSRRFMFAISTANSTARHRSSP